jgi:hypothetical protein
VHCFKESCQFFSVRQAVLMELELERNDSDITTMSMKDFVLLLVVRRWFSVVTMCKE